MDVKIGCAAVDITPQKCFATIDGKSDYPIRVVDPLYARILLLSTEHTLLLLIVLDLIGIQEKHTQKIKNSCKKLITALDTIVITATHTHSAPLTIDFYGMEKTDESYIDQIVASIMQGILAAKEHMESVNIGIGQVPCPLNVNRMNKNCRRSETNTFDIEPGIVDDDLSALVFRRMDTSLKAILWHYTAHPFTIWPEHVISADYPGKVARLCEEKLNCFSLFLPGCAGNSNPRITGGGESCAVFADKIYEYLASILQRVDYTVPSLLLTKNTYVDLPLYQGGTITVPIQQLFSDNWSLTFLPGEQFAETGLEIKKKCGPFHLAVAYANKDEIGYMPTERYYTTHTYAYECFASCLYYMTPMKAHDCTKRIGDVCTLNIQSIMKTTGYRMYGSQ